MGRVASSYGMEMCWRLMTILNVEWECVIMKGNRINNLKLVTQKLKWHLFFFDANVIILSEREILRLPDRACRMISMSSVGIKLWVNGPSQYLYSYRLVIRLVERFTLPQLLTTVCRSFFFPCSSSVTRTHPRIQTTGTKTITTKSPISWASGRPIPYPKQFHQEYEAIWWPWRGFPPDLVSNKTRSHRRDMWREFTAKFWQWGDLSTKPS
jgi:hypothetical protein